MWHLLGLSIPKSVTLCKSVKNATGSKICPYQHSSFDSLLWALLFTEIWLSGSFGNQKTQPNMIPSKVMAIWLVDLDSKIECATFHWS